MTNNSKFSSVSVDTTIIHKLLVAVPVGGTISYDAISNTIGRDVTKDARYLLESARRIAMREDRAVFGVKRGEGLVRLDDSGTVARGAEGLARARRTIRKHSRILSCVKDFNSMAEEDKVRHNTMLSVYGALYAATKPKSVAKVEAAVSTGQQKLATKKTLALFAD